MFVQQRRLYWAHQYLPWSGFHLFWLPKERFFTFQLNKLDPMTAEGREEAFGAVLVQARGAVLIQQE
jgi:hypothetical protein